MEADAEDMTFVWCGPQPLSCPAEIWHLHLIVRDSRLRQHFADLSFQASVPTSLSRVTSPENGGSAFRRARQAQETDVQLPRAKPP